QYATTNLYNLARINPLNPAILLISSILIRPLEEVNPRAARHPWRLPQRHHRIHSCAGNGPNRRAHRCTGHRTGRIETRVLTDLRTPGVVVCSCGPRGFGYEANGIFEHDVYGFAQNLDVRGDLGDVETNNEVEAGGPFL